MVRTFSYGNSVYCLLPIAYFLLQEYLFSIARVPIAFKDNFDVLSKLCTAIIADHFYSGTSPKALNYTI